jgi:hypothetical protein
MRFLFQFSESEITSSVILTAWCIIAMAVMGRNHEVAVRLCAEAVRASRRWMQQRLNHRHAQLRISPDAVWREHGRIDRCKFVRNLARG